MKLSEKEKSVLAAVQMNGLRSVADVAELTKLRPSTVRYQIDSLRRREILADPQPFINVYRLGYIECVIYFSLSAENQHKKGELLQTIADTPAVSWVCEHGGEFQYSVGICARHLSEVIVLLNQVSEEHEMNFFEKSISVRLSVIYMGRKFLLNAPPEYRPFIARDTGDTVEFDETDKEVLSLLAQDNGSSMSQLAKAANIPVSTFERRKRRLEEKDVIVGYFARIDAAQLGMHKYKLLISAKGINPQLRQDLCEFARTARYIGLFSECIGSWDYECFIEVPSPRGVSEVVEQLYDTFGSALSSIKVLTIFGYSKYRMYPFFNN